MLPHLSVELYPSLSWGFKEQAKKKKKKRGKERRKKRKKQNSYCKQKSILKKGQFLKDKTMNSYESPREKRNHFGVILRAAWRYRSQVFERAAIVQSAKTPHRNTECHQTER